jgi:hypothetical protein
MTTEAATYPGIARAFILNSLPSAVRVLAVTARPGQSRPTWAGCCTPSAGRGPA